MTNEIDMSKVVLWQYDNAHKFLRLLRMKEDLANYMVKDVWDWYQNHLFGIWTHTVMDEYDKFGLWVWGTVLGVPRPLKEDGTSISDLVYLHILKARFYLMNADGSAATLNRYLSLVFDAGNGSGNPGHNIMLLDNYDMTMSYKFNWVPTDDETAVISADWVLPHPTGVKIASYEALPDSRIFGFDGYYAPLGGGMVEVTIKTMYGYEDEDENVIVKDSDYYVHMDSSRMIVSYDEEGDYYYIVLGGLKVRVPSSEYKIYWQPDVTKPLTDDIELTEKVDKGSFVYNVNGTTVVATTVKDKDGHTLIRDNKGYYYMSGLVKVYVLGQNLGVFNNSVFHRDGANPVDREGAVYIGLVNDDGSGQDDWNLGDESGTNETAGIVYEDSEFIRNK